MRRPAAWLGRLMQASPLRLPEYRVFYLGAVGTALGYTMLTTISSWLMATLTPSELLVALVQTASSLPTLVLGLVAGALADIVDRRRVILVSQAVMLGAALILSITTLIGATVPASVFVLTFVVGCGFTFYYPAQHTSVSELVPRQELPSAVALSAVAFNAARAVGPLIAGSLAAWVGTGSAILASAAFFLPMMAIVGLWHRDERGRPPLSERLFNGIGSGLRFVWHSERMRALLVRGLSFSICASALWALLPVIARDLLGLGAKGFSLLAAGFGLGAVLGAWHVPRKLKQVGLNQVALYGSLLWALAIGVIASTGHLVVATLAVGVAGVAWIYVLAGVATSVQSSAPAWVRARAVSMNLVTTQASLALGSALWGLLASIAGTRITLGVSAVIHLMLYALTRRFKANMAADDEVLPRTQVPELVTAFEPPLHEGPFVVQIEYRIEASRQPAFLQAIYAVGPTRRRTGATTWGVFRDLEEPERIFERYIVPSWGDYLLHRARMTVADGDLQEQARGFQRQGLPVRVTRMVGIEQASRSPEAYE